MKYTKHLSIILNSNGVPNMRSEQFKTLMNIVHLEGRLTQLTKLKERAKKSREPHRYDLGIQDVSQQITDLTRNCDPKAFFILLLGNED